MHSARSKKPLWKGYIPNSEKGKDRGSGEMGWTGRGDRIGRAQRVPRAAMLLFMTP